MLLNLKNLNRLVWLTVACSALPAAGPIDFPAALNTRWTYHQHTELGQGVHFNEEDEKLAKGNLLDKVVISTATGLDTMGAVKYTRVETRQMDGKSAPSAVGRDSRQFDWRCGSETRGEGGRRRCPTLDGR